MREKPVWKSMSSGWAFCKTDYSARLSTHSNSSSDPNRSANHDRSSRYKVKKNTSVHYQCSLISARRVRPEWIGYVVWLDREPYPFYIKVVERTWNILLTSGEFRALRSNGTANANGVLARDSLISFRSARYRNVRNEYSQWYRKRIIIFIINDLIPRYVYLTTLLSQARITTNVI